MLSDHHLLNPALVAALTRAGHGDVVVIADAGLPLPERPVIDLSLVPGIPRFIDVVRAIRGSLCVESAILAEESTRQPQFKDLSNVIGDVPMEVVSHEAFKGRVSRAQLIVRTGECTAFSNVAFRAGVTF